MPSASTIRSDRERSRRPEGLVGRQRDPGALLGQGGREPRRHVELGGAGGVARRVVVDPAVRADPDRGQRPRAGAVVDDGHGDLGAGDEPLQQRHRPVGERVDHRAGQLVGRRDHGAAQRGAAAGGLDHQRQPESLDQRGHHVGRTELAEGLVREADGLGRVQPGPRDDRLGDRLVEGRPRGRRESRRRTGWRAARGSRGSRRPRRSRRAASGPRRTAGPRGATRAGRRRRRARRPRRRRRAAPRRPGGPSAATRRARDEPAGQDEDGVVAHACSLPEMTTS